MTVQVCLFSALTGGTSTLAEVIRSLPRHANLAYVVKDADQVPKALAETLTDLTDMPLVPVTDRTELQPGRVYLIASDSEAVVDGDVLRVSAKSMQVSQGQHDHGRDSHDGLRQDRLTQQHSHRLRNTLALVQAIARQPVRRNMSLPEFRDRFLGRIRAVAHAHDQLLATGWTSAELGVLIEAALQAHDGDRVTYGGPEVRLSPRQTLCLALVLHELDSNAVKHGCLSSSGGRLTVVWTVEGRDAPEVLLSWQERNGPPPVRLTRPDGFGMQMIREAAAYELDGAVDCRLDPEGLTLSIRFPLA